MPTKILVADDSVTMRRVLEMTFAGEDARVVSVDSAEAALTKAAELSPDVVFADVSLPGSDGYDLCRRLKASGSSKAAVIVLASQHHPYDESKGRAAGVDDHMSKPFDTQAMIDRVNQVLARPRATPAQAAAPAQVAPAVEAPRPAAPPPPVAAAPVARPPAPAAPPAQAARPPQPAIPAPAVGFPPPASPAVAAKPAASSQLAAPVGNGLHGLESKLAGLGLSADQLAGVLALSREVIEQVVWEVVPDLAEALIKEELRRLTAD